uniref:DExD/H-box helicase 60 n=1 Tax=Sphenodon punctatus TaxID=8508 RepID=A0A8D0HVH6_SPHPU
EEIPKAEYASLLNDYVESEFFLIDGDSLFITCISEEKLQLGQNLHFFYIMERFLLDLTSKGGKYVIVFFKDAEHVYLSHPHLLSLRTTMILHLQNNTDIPIYTEFSNCLEHEWQLFLKDRYPYFLIVSDEGLNKSQTNFINILIIHALSKSINVVLTSGQESDTIRVYGYLIHSIHSHRSEVPSEVNRELTLQEATDLIRMYCLSVVFLSHLSLSQRAQVRLINSDWNKEVFTFIQWVSITFILFFHSFVGLQLDMGKGIQRDYVDLWNIVSEESYFGASFPLRETTRLFLEQKHSLPKGNNLQRDSTSFCTPKLRIKSPIFLALQPFSDPSREVGKDNMLQLAWGPSSLFGRSKDTPSGPWYQMAGLNICLEVWKEHCRNQDKKTKDLSIAAQMMRMIHVLIGKHQELLQKHHLKKLAKCLQYLGFENLAYTLSTQITESDNEKIAKYSVEMGAARFQLQCMGHYLFRDERSDPDPRVQHFIPDTWQRELLDVVDNNESALIVAPTSSGKTYASYYCMEKVLRESNEGVVVYVSPTKALVNQVVGTIYNRFTKKLPHGLVVCGVFTRDYRHDTMNCQILVTVPQCLEILLLSPHRQEWVKKIKYVIFDEVHCLGGEIGAEVWEHLLVMIRCPFLALSVTISNPEHLTDWLQSVKRYWQNAESTMEEIPNSFTTARKGTRKAKIQNTKKKSYTVKLVLYGERYNDLEKYVCSLKDDSFIIDHYHPCAALTVSHIENYGIPSDIAFSPRESIQLYDTMVKVWQEWPRVQELDPEEFVYFKNKIIITKADARKYEQELKKELTVWISLGQSEKIFRRVRYQRKGMLQKKLARRGIGYHHASMAYKERQVVEMLFRMGYIRVVTATGSLALGINMPCKSVVFNEDSVFLDALNYRQMSGRAGRRGQDVLGSVFFYDIPLPKVEKLIKSNVPQLKGQFPLSISLILRLMLLAAKADDKLDARAKVLSVLSHSLMTFKQPKIEEMLKIYFIFSLQFLVKEGYLDEEGNPMGFTGLVTHLHYHEPSNFVLVSFLTKGLLHKLCQPIEKGSTVFSEDVMETLVLVLANLFGRKYLPACTTEFKGTFSQSKVFLDDLPEDFAAAVHEYNSKIEKNFGCFLLTTTKLADMEQEYQLPLSRTDFTGKNDDPSELTSHLMNSNKNITAVSPFACLSGMMDEDLFSAQNINKAVLRTIGVNAKNATLLWLKKYDYAERRMPLNAYALDFYKHGSLIALTRDNWYAHCTLKIHIKFINFSVFIYRISLGELCDDENDNVVLAFKQLSKGYGKIRNETTTVK